MIKSLLFYYYRDYKKSYKYVAPLIFYMICLATTYTYNNNDVLQSYSLTAAFIYITSIWLNFSSNEVEDNVQQQLVILNIKNENIYYLCKIFFMFILVLVLDMAAVLYPILKGSFDRSVAASDVTASLIIHGIMGLLGISFSALFNSRLMENRKLALISLLLIVTVSLIQGVIIKEYPFIKGIVLILPPAYFVIETLSTSKLVIFHQLIIPFAAGISYSFLLIYLYLKLMKKKAF